MNNELVSALRADVGDEVEHAREALIAVRGRLRDPYRDRPAESLLGPPVPLAVQDDPDSLVALRDRVVAAGGPSHPLQRLIRAEQALRNLVEQYARGDLATLTVQGWRDLVERVYVKVEDALDSADQWLAAWRPRCEAPHGRGRNPDLGLLDQHELLNTTQLARVLDVHRDTAGRRAKGGEFGEPVQKGRRIYVRSALVRASLGE